MIILAHLLILTGSALILGPLLGWAADGLRAMRNGRCNGRCSGRRSKLHDGRPT